MHIKNLARLYLLAILSAFAIGGVKGIDRAMDKISEADKKEHVSVNGQSIAQKADAAEALVKRGADITGNTDAVSALVQSRDNLQEKLRAHGDLKLGIIFLSVGLGGFVATAAWDEKRSRKEWAAPAATPRPSGTFTIG